MVMITLYPQGEPDPSPNVPSGTEFASTGAWRVDQRVGNSNNVDGLDFLIDPSTGHATPFVDRSFGPDSNEINWPAAIYGTFVTAAAGDDGGDIEVECAILRNGLCVGWFDYNTYDDLASHRRTQTAYFGSNYINDAGLDPTLERPHLLGPGNHSGLVSGLHMPYIQSSVGDMAWGVIDQGTQGEVDQIIGSSFSAPSLLGAAIQSLEYAGWFSPLAYPMVNKAVLLASTVDANNDGAIGKGNTWSNQPSDAEDGAGQVDLANVEAIIDNGRYFWRDLADIDFTSCGTGCRQYTVASINIPAYENFRTALAWQACMLTETDVPTINNDLDLALDCGSRFFPCGGVTTSNATSSEVEMIERPYCTIEKTCSLEVRIKNGATLAACGSTTTERIGVAWSFGN